MRWFRENEKEASSRRFFFAARMRSPGPGTNGINCDYIACHNHKETGKCLVTLNEKMIPSYNLLSDVAYDEITCPQLKEQFDVLYFGTFTHSNNNKNNVLRME